MPSRPVFSIASSSLRGRITEGDLLHDEYALAGQLLMKRVVIDLDGTLTVDEPDVPYTMKRPRPEVVEAVRRWKADGYDIIVFTARNMRTFSGSVGKINLHTLPVIAAWLKQHDIPVDELLVGKPWCGTDGFYVDDRALRPEEFARMSPNEVHALFKDHVVE